MEVNESIKYYFNFINEHFKSIDSINIEHNEATYKKLLYVSVLDILSHIMYPKKYQRDRFISLLQNFSKWEHGFYVSLPHLFKVLQENINPLFRPIKRVIKFNLKKWNKSDITKLNNDISIQEIKSFLPDKFEFKYQNKKIYLK